MLISLLSPRVTSPDQIAEIFIDYLHLMKIVDSPIGSKDQAARIRFRELEDKLLAIDVREVEKILLKKKLIQIVNADCWFPTGFAQRLLRRKD